MKIICFIDNLGSGGAQRQIIKLADMLLTGGHDVSVLTYGSVDFYRFLLEEKSIKHHVLKNINGFQRIIEVRKYLHSSAPDVVISFLDTPNFLACISNMKRNKFKLIVSERSSKVTSFIAWKQKIFKWFYKYSDFIVCNSYSAAELWKKFYPEYESKLTTIYNIMEPIEIEKEVPYNNTELRKHSLVIAASYQYLKNPIGFVKAVILLPDEYREKILINWYGQKEVTAGNTEEYEKTKELIEQNSLENIIILNDETNEIYEKMFMADAVGLFSKVEGLPNVICEGMMLSKPIIMTKVSDWKILVDEMNGFLCDSEDIESIKNSLIAFIDTSHENLYKMGKVSNEKAHVLFDMDMIKNKWLDIINT